MCTVTIEYSENRKAIDLLLSAIRELGAVVTITEENEPRYNPAFCVQPLYYMLSFLAAQYGREKKNRSFIDKIFASIYSLFDSDEALFDEILKMEKYRKTDLPGYEVECGADLFKYCK